MYSMWNCENTCPETAIKLNPQINLKNEALSQKTYIVKSRLNVFPVIDPLV